MSRVYVTQTPPPIALLLWEHIEPLLAKALEYAHGEFDIGQLREMVYRGSMVPILIFEGVDLVAAAAVERINYPGKVSMRIALLGGDNMEHWLPDLVKYIDSMALAWGVNDIEIAGRRGWLRTLEEHGYGASYTILRKDMSKPDVPEIDHE